MDPADIAEVRNKTGIDVIRRFEMPQRSANASQAGERATKGNKVEELVPHRKNEEQDPPPNPAEMVEVMTREAIRDPRRGRPGRGAH